MKKYFLFIFFPLFVLSANAGEGRYTFPLTGRGWSLWLDKEAGWQNDRLYLPHEITDLSLLPVNRPTGGWQVLSNNPDAVSVEVPGTVEEYLTVSDNPRPEDFRGVSWWYRKIKIPADQKNKRFIIYFESVRMRAEVYLDGKLVAYDLIGETPFQVDITDEAKPGTEQLLAVRVTNPGGNFHWQDFDILKWGEYMGAKSKRKGNEGEREFLRLLKDRGIDAQRNDQMFKGGTDNPDIGAQIGGRAFHFEVKRTERFRLYDAVEQAQSDANGHRMPVVAHRMNRKPWVVVLTLEDFMRLAGVQSLQLRKEQSLI